jgi:hypothetical protein
VINRCSVADFTPIEPPPYRLTVADRARGFIWGISEPFRRDKTPAWASILALLLAIAPGLRERYATGRWGEYDPTIAVLTATLIALIWTAHYTFRSVRHARQAEERENTRRWFAKRSMAAGVLAELEYMRQSLDLLRGRIYLREIHFLERPQLRHALAHVDLFSPETASKLSEFDSVLRQIESHSALYGADHAAAERAAAEYGVGVVGRPILTYNIEWVESIRRLISAAETMIPLLTQHLLSEA